VKKRNGFTLIELFIVVLIIAILAAIAIPVISKNMEKSKTGEVVSTLNLIRMAEKDYYLDSNPKTYTTDFSLLNIDNPNNVASANRYFTYTIPTGNAVGFTATATRKDGSYTGDWYTIDQNGTITSSGRFQL